MLLISGAEPEVQAQIQTTLINSVRSEEIPKVSHLFLEFYGKSLGADSPFSPAFTLLDTTQRLYRPISHILLCQFKQL